MSHNSKRVFLTGASGFVASQILADLIEVYTHVHFPASCCIDVLADDIYVVGLPDHGKREI